MKAGKTHKHLSREEIKDYLSGELSGSEQNRIERHLLECELCSDAVEGLAQLNPAEIESGFQTLDTRLEEKQPVKRGIAYWSYAAAAAAIVVISVSIFSWVTPEPNQHSGLVAKEDTRKPDKGSDDSQIAELKSEPAPGEEDESTEEAVTSTEKKPADELVEREQEMGEVEQEMSIKDEEVITEQQAEEEMAIADVTEDGEESTASGANPVTDDANVASNTLQKSAAAREMEAAPVRNQESFTEEEAATPSQPAQPAEGWDNFRNYISQTFAYPPQAASEGVTGVVKLEFDVMEDGSIENIEAVDGPELGCQEEAIRVLSKGPKWKPARMNGNSIKTRRNVEIECR